MVLKLYEFWWLDGKRKSRSSSKLWYFDCIRMKVPTPRIGYTFELPSFVPVPQRPPKTTALIVALDAASGCVRKSVM